MRTSFQHFSGLWILFVFIFVVNTSCVYYNTFYNAKKYFKDAENIRLENENKSLPVNAQTAYTKVIEKCDIVLEKYPDSDYVNSALLLSGQAHYHKEEYGSANQKLKQLQESGDPDFIQQAKFWIALIKWKKGKIQPSIDELNDLLNDKLFSITSTVIHLYLADIHIELKKVETALFHLESAAENTSERTEKGRIYQRLSELAFNREEYDRALNAYEQVIKNSLVKKLKQDAHLQIAKIHRLTGNYETAVKKIKSLLVDEEFKDLFGALELELVKIYDLKNETEASQERLHSIIKDYPSTEISSEAYFILGKKSIKESWNLKGAKDYFEKSNKESRKSVFIRESQEIIKYIDQYLEAEDIIYGEKDTLTISLQDTLKITSDQKADSSSINILKNDKSGNSLMVMSELEAFQLNNLDSAVVHLNIFVKMFSEHELYPKAVYMLYYLHTTRGDTSVADSLGSILISQFPDTEFAETVRKDLGMNNNKTKSEHLFSVAEKLWYFHNQENALDTLGFIVRTDTTSDFSLKSGYFLGYQYDHTLINPDSALKYYTWVESYFPESEQAERSKTRVNQIRELLALSDSTRLSPDSLHMSVSDSPKFEEDSIFIFSSVLDTKDIHLDSLYMSVSDSLKFGEDSIYNFSSLVDTSVVHLDTIQMSENNYLDDKSLDMVGVYPIYDKNSRSAQSFRKSFSNARNAGEAEFSWQNRKYSVILKEESEK